MNVIGYCMNVHPGEDLASVRAAVEQVAVPLSEALAREGTFALGLRFGVEAAQALREQKTARAFAALLRRHRLTTFGINGFPYGAFHGERVKTAVYEPDWADARRVNYTRDLFCALAQLPPAPTGEHCLSVTTVPLAYDRGQGVPEAIFRNLCATALVLRKLEGFTGLRMRLALEPEPDCLLESAQNTIDFFERLWQHPDWNPAYHDFIGVCFDTCHFAMNYEEPLNALQAIVSANIPVARVQVSAALEFTEGATREELLAFDDGTYLHQVRRREADASLTRFPDLTPETLPQILGRRGRIHCHVPLAWEGIGRLASTRRTLTPAFWGAVRAGGWPIEIETYTYPELPSAFHGHTLSEMLLQDFRWVFRQLRSASGALMAPAAKHAPNPPQTVPGAASFPSSRRRSPSPN